MDRAQLAPRQSGRAGLDLDAADGAIHIELDPGLAFGTGSHPTTHLCLAWLEAELPAGATLLDYGCGSGILAIAARKLGAGPTQAVDIDPQAVQSTVFNAQVNGVELDAMLPDGLKDGTFQVVVANILSNPLKVLAHAGRPRRPAGNWCLGRAGTAGRGSRRRLCAVDRHVGLARARRLVCTAARPERIAAAQRHGFDHPLHCGTAFKVVPDQLRIRNGLVRCGACSTVFDGRASLVQPADVPGRQAEMPVAMPAATAGRRPMRFLPWFGPRLRLPASEPVPPWEDEPAFAIPGGLGAAAIHDAAPPRAANRSAGRRRTRTRAPTSWMTMSCWTMSCMMTNRRTMNHGRSSSRRGRA